MPSATEPPAPVVAAVAPVASLPKPAGLRLEAFDDDPAALPPVVELPPQPLEAATFEQAYDQLLAELELPKAVLHAALKGRRYTLQGHRWLHTAISRIEQARLLEDMPWLVQRMRDLTQNPTLLLDIHLDETLAPVLRQYVRTREDVLEELMQRNPHLRTLIQRFGAGLDQ